MKKVVVQLLRAPAGGIRKHVVDILENLDREQYELIFISNFKAADTNLDYLQKDFGILCLDLPIEERPSPKDILLLNQIYTFLKDKNVTVLHGHGAKGGLYARLLKHPLKAKTIYTPHGGSLHRVHGKIKNFIYDIIERLMIPLTDIFLFESEYSKQTFITNIATLGKKALVNHNGVPLSEFKERNLYHPGTTIKIASFGLLRQLKGHDIAIRACKLMKAKNIPFQYDIYGEGENEQQLRMLITSLGLDENVKLKSYSKNVLADMNKYDFVLHPSRFESFGYVPVEAMAVGVPVVLSQEGGLNEVADIKTALINEHNTPEVYCTIFQKVFRGEVDLKWLVTNARAKVENQFSLTAMIRRIQNVYLNL